MLLAKYDKLTGKHHTARTPQSGREWYERGYELHNSENYQESIPAFKEAIAHGYRVEDSMYNIACGYALLDDAPNAVKWLRDAIAAGYDNYDHIAGDSDFDPIRSDAAFRQVMAEAPDHEKRKEEDRLDSTVRRYETLLQVPSADGESWFSIGMEMLPLRQYDKSIDAFQARAREGLQAVRPRCTTSPAATRARATLRQPFNGCRSRSTRASTLSTTSTTTPTSITCASFRASRS